MAKIFVYIPSSYGGKCRCGRRFGVGEHIKWHIKTRKIVGCPSCRIHIVHREPIISINRDLLTDHERKADPLGKAYDNTGIRNPWR